MNKKAEYARYRETRVAKQRAAEVRDRDGMCRICSSPYKLHAHHPYYDFQTIDGVMTDMVPLEHMITLCASCHKAISFSKHIHIGRKKGNKSRKKNRNIDKKRGRVKLHYAEPVNQYSPPEHISITDEQRAHMNATREETITV